MAEFDSRRIAALLAADTEFDVGSGGLTAFDSNLHKLAYTYLVESCEGVGFENLLHIVFVKELTGVVSGETESHLSEVIGTEGEEFSFFSDFVSSQSRSGDFYHSTDMVFHRGIVSLENLFGSLYDYALNVLQFLYVAYERYHDFGNNVETFLSYSQSSLDDSLRLHFCNFGISYGKTATSVTHHRVELVQTFYGSLKLFESQAHSLCKVSYLFVLVRYELVERRVKETDSNGSVTHCLVKTDKVLSLHRQNLSESFLSLFDRLGNYHFSNGGNSVFSEEHVLGTAKTYTLCAELNCGSSVVGSVGICSYLECAVLVRPFHYRSEVAAYACVFACDLLAVYVTRRAVEREIILVSVFLSVDIDNSLFFVYSYSAATRYTASAHTAGNNRRVRSHTASYGQYALSCVHTFDILR